jgi:periplasmic protein TorT
MSKDGFSKTLKLGLFVAATLTSTTADAADWWPFKINSAANGDITQTHPIDYVPLSKASKPWKLCVLFPHLKDSYYVAVNYGMVEEANRLGVKLTLLQAGGYDQLPKQLSQYDDCVASKADGILLSAISETAFAPKIEEQNKNGLVQVAVANPIMHTPITARIQADLYQKGLLEGGYLKKLKGDRKSVAASFPGPQGSGWAETFSKGFHDGIRGSNINVVTEQYGETGIPESLRLVEDALQTYPDIDLIWAGAPAAEAAASAVETAGKSDVTIFASYENQTMIDLVKQGKIYGFAAEYPVMMGRLGVDLAVRALEKQTFEQTLVIIPAFVTKDNIKDVDLTKIFAPEGWKPEFSVN